MKSQVRRFLMLTTVLGSCRTHATGLAAEPVRGLGAEGADTLCRGLPTA